MKPWWERWPGRLDYEIDELRKAGIRCELDQDAFKNGIAKLDLVYSFQGREQAFVVRFPDVYPYIRFEIFALDMELAHHQNPFQKNLCMIGRSTANWRIRDTVVSFILSRLPSVVQAGGSADPNEAKDLEEIQGEPVTAYYPYFPNSSVLIDSSWSVDPSLSGGFLDIGLDRDSRSSFRCVIRSIKDRSGKVLAESAPELSDLFPDQLEGKWLRCRKPILENHPLSFYERLVSQDRSLENPKWHKLNKRRIAFVGVLFPEEVAWRTERDGWIFLVLDQGGKLPV